MASMMRWAIGAILLAGQPVASAPLAPVSAWNVEYGDDLCVVSRSYGDAASPITIGFKPTPFGDLIQSVVMGPRARLGPQGPTKLMVSTPSGTIEDADEGMRIYLPDGTRTMMTYYLSRTALEALVDSRTLTIRASRSDPVTVALSMRRSVLIALQRCEADLLQHWGFDVGKIAAIATRAGPAPGDSPKRYWITADDYPTAAFVARKQGRVLIGWTITPQGKVTDCRILRSSGVPDLDTAACAAVTKRGRYSPALDAMGKPVESYSTRYVTWQLPG